MCICGRYHVPTTVYLIDFNFGAKNHHHNSRNHSDVFIMDEYKVQRGLFLYVYKALFILNYKMDLALCLSVRVGENIWNIRISSFSLLESDIES